METKILISFTFIFPHFITKLQPPKNISTLKCKWRQKKTTGLNKVLRYKIIIHNSFSVHSFHSPPGKGLESNYLLILTFKTLLTQPCHFPHLQQDRWRWWVRGTERVKEGKIEQSIRGKMRTGKWNPVGECMWAHHASWKWKQRRKEEDQTQLKVVKTKQYEILFQSWRQLLS